MTYRTVDSIFREIVLKRTAATKTRIAALEAMARPSVRLLSQIAGDAGNSDRLRMVAVQLLEVRVQLRRTMKAVPRESNQ
jgi:hypothetical protein